MRERMGWLWRSAATGFCFFVFGFAELFFAVFVFPVLMLTVRDLGRRQQIGKVIMHFNFRWFVELMRGVGVLTYEVRNLERLDRPGLLILANHPTLIDVVFMISFLKNADCIVKGALVKNPFTRYAIESAGLIPNSASGAELIDRCARSMERGNCLVVFPEGSRSDPSELLAFQRGASHIAVRSGKNITPVVIRVGAHNLGRGSRWWNPPSKPIHFVFDVQEDLAVQPFLDRQPELPAAARELTAHLRTYFQTHMEKHWTQTTPLSSS